MKSLPILLLLAVSTAVSLSAAEIIYQNGFESGDLSTLKCSGNCPEVVDTIASEGTRSGSFVLTRDRATPYRTEVSVPRYGAFQWHGDYWMRMDVYYADWADDSDREISPFQIHATPYDWQTKSPPRVGGHIGNGPLCMYIQNGQMHFNTYRANVAWKGPLEKGKWFRLVVHFIPSKDDDGLLELWKNGEKLASVKGPNSHRVNQFGEPLREPYWKMGVYKWNWKSHKPPTDTTRRHLYIDDFIIAKGADGYKLVGLEAP